MIITDDTIFHSELGKLKDTLLERGYSPDIIRKEFKNAVVRTQNDLVFGNKNYYQLSNKLTDTNKHKDRKQLLPFVIPYSEHLPVLLQKTITKHWQIIENDPLLYTIFPLKPFISFQCNTNIKDYLIRTRFTR